MLIGSRTIGVRQAFRSEYVGIPGIEGKHLGPPSFATTLRDTNTLPFHDFHPITCHEVAPTRRPSSSFLGLPRTMSLLVDSASSDGIAPGDHPGRRPGARGPRGSSLDELLATVDVEGRAGDRGVRHEVDREGGDVGRADNTPDRQGRPELVASRVEMIP